MKKTILLSLASLPLFFSACEHESISTGLDFNITLDQSNTYYAGQPVRFNIEGDVDNIIFYSGEFGSEYQYRDRYQLSTDDVTSAKFSFRIQHRWGNDEPAAEIYMSNTFEGLSGNDGEADRATVAALYEAGMPGWTKIPYDDPGDTQNQYVTIDVDLKEANFLDNFSLAFHWDPPKGVPVENAETKTTRFDTYWIDNGNITIDFEGEFETTSISLASLIDVSVMMSDELDPYYKNDGNGSIRLNDSAHDIIFAGGQQYNEFAPNDSHIKHMDCEGWVFTAPISLNKISNDQAIVIKNIQNALPYYEYTWTEPGTYEVVFVGSTADYLNSGSEVRSFTINILDTPVTGSGE